MLCSYDGVVEYECVRSWPSELVTLLERELRILKGYELRRAEIDALMKEDVLARIHTPENEHRPRRDEILREADEILAAHTLLGFHCTRLTDSERADIEAKGLRPLSQTLVEERLEKAASQGLLTCEVQRRLLSAHQADDQWREGTTHFVNCRTILSCESDVGRLFRSWGGEALYNSHEGEIDTGPVLRGIGMPAIVVTAVPIRSLQTSFTIGEGFVHKFLRDRGVPTAHAAEIETRTSEAVPASRILEIITYDDERFERLTGASGWSVPVG